MIVTMMEPRLSPVTPPPKMSEATKPPISAPTMPTMISPMTP